MYDRWQTADAKISDLEADLRKAKDAVTAANDLVDAYKTALDEAIAKSLTLDEIETLQHIVFEKRINNDSENSAAAKAIVENAEHPELEAFQTAVRKHRETTAIQAQLDALAERLTTIIRNPNGQEA